MDLRTDILPHRDRLYRLALSIVPHTAEAEDIVQETMLRAWERRDEWASIQNMAAWLSQVCRRLALDCKKSNAYQASHPAEKAEMSHDPSAHWETQEAYRLCQQLIEQLPSPQNDILRLRDIEGLSYHDIATHLNLSEDQVRVYLHRARAKVREQYVRMQGYGL